VFRRIRSDTVERAIVRDLLRRDVDVERVRELFVYLVEDSGAIFDAQARGRLLQRPGAPSVDRRTLDKWTTLLSESLLVSRLEPFAPSATGRLAGRVHPKLYASDHGLVMAFSGVADPVADPAANARALEAAVYLHLREFAPRSGLSVSYLRDKGGHTEIDFVLHEGPKARALIEVTTSQDPRKKIEQLVTSKLADKKTVRVVVHGGSEEREDGDVRLVSAQEFLLDPSRWIGGA
jgi:predicted AAA+ superfamily ATPase